MDIKIKPDIVLPTAVFCILLDCFQASDFHGNLINTTKDDSSSLTANKARVSHPTTFGLDDYFLRSQEEAGSQPRLRICFDPEQVSQAVAFKFVLKQALSLHISQKL